MKRRIKVKYSLAAAIACLTFLVYLRALQNEFVEWDDNAYVFENPFIKSFDLTFFKWAFFDFYASNWHPLTWISHALDYAVWGLDPMGHHLTNNILHAVNTFLVVVLVVRLIEAGRKLTNNKISPNPSFPKRGPSAPPPLEKGDRGGFSDNSVLITAATTGLLFGIHPLHVESVAWIAERKDLLCALFYLLSILAYVKYACNAFLSFPRLRPAYRWLAGNPSGAGVDRGKDPGQAGMTISSLRYPGNYYFLALFFFILALLSKPMAVSLPFVLLILDWYPFSRITSYKTFGRAFIGKLPFIALSIVSAVLTILAQRAGDTIRSTEFAPLSARLLVASKSLTTYLWNMILPFNLTPFYPYPRKISFLSMEYFLPVVIIIGLSVICIVTAKKQKLWISVWGYYVLTLLPVLGLIQVGDQALADRYMYLPCLGPFLILGLLAAWGSEKVYALNSSQGLKIASISAPIIVLLCMSCLTFQQISVWENSVTLWNFVIEKTPDRIHFAYYNRGLAFAKMGQYQKSLEEFDKAISLLPFGSSQYYNNRGVSYMNVGLFDKAIEDFKMAVTLDPNNNSAYYNLGLAYYRRGSAFLLAGKKEIAIADFQEACNLENKNGCNILQDLGS